MKILIDTNIFLNLLLKREGYKEAQKILNGCAKGEYIGVVCDITLLNIDYIASKQSADIYEFLQTINDTFIVIGIDNALFEQALSIKNDDLEDSVQYVCAKASGCKLIVSDDKSFYKGDIRVISSKNFVQEIKV